MTARTMAEQIERRARLVAESGTIAGRDALHNFEAYWPEVQAEITAAWQAARRQEGAA